MDQYTHDFVYRMGDGGQFVIGECEFDKDKKVSYRIQSWSEPLQHEFLNDFVAFIDRAKLRFDEYKGIKLVKLIEKGYIEP